LQWSHGACLPCLDHLKSLKHNFEFDILKKRSVHRAVKNQVWVVNIAMDKLLLLEHLDYPKKWCNNAWSGCANYGVTVVCKW
jgi:hypothetical protein